MRAFALYRIDYCNVIPSLAYIPSTLLVRMQKAINSAAKLVLSVRRQEHIIRHLKHLRWLTIPQRIDFKLAGHAYRWLCRCEDRLLLEIQIEGGNFKRDSDTFSVI
jgi:hypothetical protein